MPAHKLRSTHVERSGAGRDDDDRRVERTRFRISSNARASISADGLVLLDLQGASSSHPIRLARVSGSCSSRSLVAWKLPCGHGLAPRCRQSASCGRVDEACVWYVKRALSLQRSAVAPRSLLFRWAHDRGRRSDGRLRGTAPPPVLLGPRDHASFVRRRLEPRHLGHTPTDAASGTRLHGRPSALLSQRCAVRDVVEL